MVSGGQRLWLSRVTQGVGNIEGFNSGDAHDIASTGLSHFGAFQSVITHNLQDFTVAASPIAIYYSDRGVWLTAPRVMRPTPMTPT